MSIEGEELLAIAKEDFKKAIGILAELRGKGVSKFKGSDRDDLEEIVKRQLAGIKDLWNAVQERDTQNTSLQEELERTKKELQQMSEKNKQLASYAAVAATGVAKGTNILPSNGKAAKKRDPHSIVKVYPKENPATGELSTASSEATKKSIGMKLIGSGIGVTSLWKTNNKGVAISCRTREEAEQLTTIVNQQMAGAFEATKQNLRNPVITILLTDDRYADVQTHPQLVADILDKNAFLTNSAENPNEARKLSRGD
ncbi:hypothetical protein TYRP_005673 [Tyrophagus putrescentiae]|nr:hypothetical protein TYRP_005673 [Tyrophagus putrescentiae]